MVPTERKRLAEAIAEGREFASEIEDDEPTTEELIETLRESLEDVKAGRTGPARELLRELREIVAEDADSR